MAATITPGYDFAVNEIPTRATLLSQCRDMTVTGVDSDGLATSTTFVQVADNSNASLAFQSGMVWVDAAGNLWGFIACNYSLYGLRSSRTVRVYRCHGGFESVRFSQNSALVTQPEDEFYDKAAARGFVLGLSSKGIASQSQASQPWRYAWSRLAIPAGVNYFAGILTETLSTSWYDGAYSSRTASPMVVRGRAPLFMKTSPPSGISFADASFGMWLGNSEVGTDVGWTPYPMKTPLVYTSGFIAQISETLEEKGSSPSNALGYVFPFIDGTT